PPPEEIQQQVSRLGNQSCDDCQGRWGRGHTAYKAVQVLQLRPCYSIGLALSIASRRTTIFSWGDIDAVYFPQTAEERQWRHCHRVRVDRLADLGRGHRRDGHRRPQGQQRVEQCRQRDDLISFRWTEGTGRPAIGCPNSLSLLVSANLAAGKDKRSIKKG